MGIFLPGGGQLLDVSADFLSGFRDPRFIHSLHQSASLQNPVDHFVHARSIITGVDLLEWPGNLFRKLAPQEQQMLFENTARAMGDAGLHHTRESGIRGGRT
jgi:hypothetical protein